MPFEYQRSIRFPDTDAAGVVFFANTLRICHEAYEESLAAAGIDMASFFSASGTIVPIAKCEADYLRPLRCGDRITVRLSAMRIDVSSFSIQYEILRSGTPAKAAARARTEHVCVDTTNGKRTTLPAPLERWLEANAATGL